MVRLPPLSESDDWTDESSAGVRLRWERQAAIAAAAYSGSGAHASRRARSRDARVCVLARDGAGYERAAKPAPAHMENFEAAMIEAASPSSRPPKDQQVAPSLGLILEDHFTPRYSPCARRRLWAVRNRQPISIMATTFNLLILLGGIRSLNAFAPLDLSSHHISTDSCAEPTDHGSCRRAINARYGAAVEDPLLQRTGRFYFYAAHVTVTVWLLLDLWRYIGRDCAVLDYLLGFHSAARERTRLRAFLLLLVPYAHLLALYCLPVRAGACCVGTPTLAALTDRARTLAFLLFVTGYCLLGDSHNHGYLLLRLAEEERSALVLLRAHLEKQQTGGADAGADGAELESLRSSGGGVQ